jgi:hypothetical protein
MIGLIERFRRRFVARSVAPLMLIAIVGPTHPGPIGRRASGNAGVIPLPGPATSSAAGMSRLDGIGDLRRDTRADRGRVLYSAGKMAHDNATVRTLHRRSCPEQRVVAARAPLATPAS